jgi:Asp-tRNA(Asn)/Glu-tRNA(Gln) amidotransferase C subunit
MRGRLAFAGMTPDELRALAATSGLELPEERVQPVLDLLEQVLAAVEELERLPLAGVEPLLEVGRPDTGEPGAGRGAAGEGA